MIFTRNQKFRNLFINISLIIMAVFITAAGLETFLAFFHPSRITPRPFFHIQNFFCQYHPIMGWVNKPGYDDVVRVTRDFSFRVTHNSKGLRGKEHGYDRVPGKYRVLVLGDSFAWGFGVEDNEVFSSVLESASPDLEVINMGVTGYGTDQELLYYTEEGFKYKPDLVVLAFFSNDLDEISSSISYGYPKPFFELHSNPFTVTNVPVPNTDETEEKLFDNPETVLEGIKKFLRRHTNTYPFIARRLNSVAWIRNLLLSSGIAQDPKIGSGLPYYKLDALNDWWRLLFRLIRELKTTAARNGSDFLLLNIPLKESPPGRSFYPGVPGKEAAANNLIDNRIKAFARREGIEFLDLLPKIRKGQDKGLKYYNTIPIDIHLNTEGHRLLASSILDRIKKSRISE